MRGLRSLIILLVIAIPIGWYAYKDSRRPAGDDAPKKDKVFTVEADKIEELAIKAESGEQTRLQKTGAEWKMVEPAGVAPDNSEVSGITSNLATLETQRVVDENPSALGEY